MAESNTIHINMFGNFSVFYNNEPVVLERNPAGNASHILQFLLFNLHSEVPKETLLDAVFCAQATDNPSNNLKVNLLRLRKLMSASLPPDNYILTLSKSYTINPNIAISCDCKIFENFMERSQSPYVTPSQKLTLLLSAVNTYTGEFLPHLKNVPWADKARENYRKLYLSCLEDINTLLKAENRQNEFLEISSKAAEIHPLDEDFIYLKILSLAETNHIDEAKSEYRHFSENLFNAAGKSPSERLHALCSSFAENTDTLSAKGLSKTISETTAHAMDFESFKIACRLAAEVSHKNNLHSYVTLCTLADNNGTPLVKGEKLNNASTLFTKTLENTLPHSAVFARCTPNQFAILIADTTHEKFLKSISAILSAFDEYKVRAVRITTSSTPL